MADQKRRLVIAIDGPVGAGKSTAARRLADALGYVHVDSGAMYRAIGWKVAQAGVDLRDRRRVAAVAAATEIRVEPEPEGPHILVDGVDVTALLRTPAMDEASSVVSVYPEVRNRLVAIQRDMAKEGGIVMDGRDIGTVVFPDADLKFYLDAELAVRARRRLYEVQQSGTAAGLEAVRAEVASRDERDRGRETSPLAAAPDAIRIDSTALDAEGVLGRMLAEVREFLKPDNS